MFYITTSRPYTNAVPHLGTAMDPIYADCLRRYFGQRQASFFSMGTDEHSFKIVDKALEMGISPKEFVDQKYQEFKNCFDRLGIDYDNFEQNSTPKHHWVANLVWQKLQNKGLIYKKSYLGLYCPGCEDFYASSQLFNGRCPVHTNLKIQEVEEENYFFRLSNFSQQLLKYLDQVFVPDKSVIAEMKNFAKNLQDISISRERSRLKIDWGVPVSSDPKQLMYVWFEALLTYLTPLIEQEIFDAWQQGDETIKKNCEVKFWQILKEKLPQNLQIIGRDNAKFHLIIWPAILFGLDLNPIEKCLVHGMITDNLGRKFAKSLGNGVSLEDLLAGVGSEGVRFFVLHDCNSVGDTAFDWNRVIDSFNANLANNLGNLVVRTSNLIQKLNQGKISQNSQQQNLVSLELIYNHLDNLAVDKAFAELMRQYSILNQFLEQNKPWQLAKEVENQEKVDQILTVLALSLLDLNQVLKLFLPQTADSIAQVFCVEVITKSPILFQRIETKN